MLSFHALRVAAVEQIAEDAACVTLAIPPALRDAYAHHAGQYVTVRRTIGAREERRTYSIVTAPGGAVLKLGIRLQSQGRMSAELGSKLAVGDFLDVATPMGRFHTAVSADRRHAYVAFAAGSGITPILSLATNILERERESRFTLFFGNRSASTTMFLEETLALKNRHIDRFAVHFVMSRESQPAAWLNGRIDGAKIREISRYVPELAHADEYFICGPGNMVDEVRAAVKEMNGRAPIRFERFAGPSAPPVAAPAAAAADSGGQPAPDDLVATVTVEMDGRCRSFPMARRDESVLAAAERAGVELPFSCRSGICATCRTKIIAGAATMAYNIALEPWEIAAGFVLCCQARPTTPTLEISYDHK